ncbi:MAG: hypothetical protein ACTHNY_11045, partial [Solirubrobacterales bacterium]
ERLEATLVFDHPSPAALGAHLLGRFDPGRGQPPLDSAIEALGVLLEELDVTERERAHARLRSLLAGQDEGADASADDAEAEAIDRIQAASAEEILAIVNDEIGTR